MVKLLEPGSDPEPDRLAPFTANPAEPGTSIEGVTKGAYILADSEAHLI